MFNIDPHRRNAALAAPMRDWAFIPVIVCVAALCLVLFFVSPIFDNQSTGAPSARPGAATSTTRPLRRNVLEVVELTDTRTKET